MPHLLASSWSRVLSISSIALRNDSKLCLGKVSSAIYLLELLRDIIESSIKSAFTSSSSFSALYAELLSALTTTASLSDVPRKEIASTIAVLTSTHPDKHFKQILQYLYSREKQPLDKGMRWGIGKVLATTTCLSRSSLNVIIDVCCSFVRSETSERAAAAARDQLELPLVLEFILQVHKN